MFTYFQKSLIGSLFLVMVFGVMMATPVSAAAVNTTGTYLTSAAREALIQTLMAQVRILQAQLVELQKAEALSISQGREKAQSLNPLSAADYTRGPVDAPIQIVTYTDLDCPFCKMFHDTLNTIVSKYPQVAVTYRHFPIEQLHPNAKDLAIAAECVGSLGGDKAFWNFTDALFNSRSVNSETDMTKVTGLALKSGISSNDFAQCRQSDVARMAVEADMVDGTRNGVQGTPMSFLLYDSQVGEINGAQPLMVVEDIINSLLK